MKSDSLLKASSTHAIKGPFGLLALEHGGKRLPLQVLQCAAGFYLGTQDENGPYSRESLDYWGSETEAQIALEGIEGKDWVQRQHP